MTDQQQQHPISPPPELVKQWVTEVWREGTPARLSLSDMHVATQAARWGADQELEACINELRAARRPRPLSLKEQRLAEVNRLIALIPKEGALNMAGAIRCALEQLDRVERA